MSRTSYLSRRLFVVAPWLLVGGCSAAPPPPPPAVLRAPPVAEVKKPPPPAPWIEISGEDSRTSIVGYASDGRPTYHFRVKYLKGVALSPEGEACFVANTPSNNWGGGVSLDFTCVDRAGRVLWQHKDVGDLSYRLLFTGDKLRAFWSGGFSTFDALTGKETAGLPFPSFSDMMVSEDLIATVGAQISLRTLEGDVLWSVAARPFSSPTSPSFGGTAVAVDSGGTVLAGAFDGTLVAIARDGKPLYQLGVHGRVEHIESRTDGDFVVHTPRRAIVIGPGGVVRREVDDSDEPSPKTGIVDRRSPPHRPPLPLTAGYLVEQARLSGQPFEEIMSVAPLGPNDTWAMGSWSDDLRLYHFDGRAWTVMGAAKKEFPKEVYLKGKPASTSDFTMPRLARGPKGTLLMVGLRGGEAGKRLCVLEYDAGSFRERADFRPIFEETPLTSNVGPTYAVSPSGREVVCGGEPDTCVEAGPGLAPRTLSAEAGATIDSAWQDRFPAVFGGETLWNVRGVASPDGHVFAFGNRGLLHWVGGETRLVSTPFDKPLHVWAASERDVWVADKDHLARFDGSRWVGVLEARGRMFGSGSDDLWALDDGALWHITPDPRAKPDVVGFAAPAPPPVPGSVALPVGASDSAYHLERAQIDIDGARPLRTATGIANVPGGGLWFYEGSRVVEQDGKIARVIHEAPAPKPFQCWVPADEDQEFRYRCSPRRPFPAKCQQCVAPRKLGEGAVLSDREWHAVHAGVSAPLGVQLTQVTAMAASPSGAIWAVSADQDRQPGALIQTPDTSRFLRGLPPAVYEGIGIRADDDVWLSGGLTYGDVGDVGETYGPSWEATGEGTLVHFDGHTFTRHRGPEGTLLAVAAVGPNEAWAVGLFGGVVHVKDGVSEAYHLERGGAPLRVTLRAVSASGPDDVWIAGDESTLLHWNGKALSAVDPGPLGRRAAFMGVTPPRTEAGWLVGPAGLWRIARTPQAPQQKL